MNAAGSHDEAGSVYPHILNRAWEHESKVESAACETRMDLQNFEMRALSNAERCRIHFEQRSSEAVESILEERDHHVQGCEQRVLHAEMRKSELSLGKRMAERRVEAAEQFAVEAKKMSKEGDPEDFQQLQSAGVLPIFRNLCTDGEVQDALLKLAEAEHSCEANNEAGSEVAENQAVASIRAAKAEALRAFEARMAEIERSEREAAKEVLTPENRRIQEKVQELEQAARHFIDSASLEKKTVWQEANESEEKMEAAAKREITDIKLATWEFETSEETRVRSAKRTQDERLHKPRTRVDAAQKEVMKVEHEAAEAKALVKAAHDQTLLAMQRKLSANEHAAHEELKQIHAEGEQQLAALRIHLAAEGQAIRNASEQVVAEELQQVQQNDDLRAEVEEAAAGVREREHVAKHRAEVAWQREFQAAEHAYSENEQESQACEAVITKLRIDHLETIEQLRVEKEKHYAQADAIQQSASESEDALQSSLRKAVLDAKEQAEASKHAASLQNAVREEELSAAEEQAVTTTSDAGNLVESLMLDAQKKSEDFTLLSRKIQEQTQESIESIRARRKQQVSLADQKAMRWSTREAEIVTSKRFWEQEEVEMYQSRLQFAEDIAAAARTGSFDEVEQAAAAKRAATRFVEEETKMQHQELQDYEARVQTLEQETAVKLCYAQLDEEEAKQRAAASESQTHEFEEASVPAKSRILRAHQEREQAAADSVLTASAEASAAKDKEQQSVAAALSQKQAILKSMEEAADEHEQETLAVLASSMQTAADHVKGVRAEEKEFTETVRALQEDVDNNEQTYEQEELEASVKKRASEEHELAAKRLEEALELEESASKDRIAAIEHEAAEALKRLHDEQQAEVAALKLRSAAAWLRVAPAEERERAAAEAEAASDRQASETLEDIEEDRSHRVQILSDRVSSAERAIREFVLWARTSQQTTSEYINNTVEAPSEGIPLCDEAEQVQQEVLRDHMHEAESAAQDLTRERANV